MKKIVFASVLLAFTFSACAGKNNEKKSEEINQQKEIKKNGNNSLNQSRIFIKSSKL